MRRTDSESEKPTRPNRRRQLSWKRARSLVLVMLTLTAVVTELRKPKAERTWEGQLGGLIPYDLRRPTLARARLRWWNASDKRIFVPKVLGVGWTVNFRRVVDLSAAQLGRREA